MSENVNNPEGVRMSEEMAQQIDLALKTGIVSGFTAIIMYLEETEFKTKEEILEKIKSKEAGMRIIELCDEELGHQGIVRTMVPPSEEFKVEQKEEEKAEETDKVETEEDEKTDL